MEAVLSARHIPTISATCGVLCSLQSKCSSSLSLSVPRHRHTRQLCLALPRERNCSVVRAQAVEAESTSTATSFDHWTKDDSYFATDTRPVVLFDGVCNMCNGGVNFLLDNDAEGKLRFAALQSEAGRALLVRSDRAPDDISSVVMVDKDSWKYLQELILCAELYPLHAIQRAYIKSEAVLQIAQYLNFPFPTVGFLGILVPMFLRDVLYDTVADNRYSTFGRRDACRLSDPKFGARFIQ